MHITFAVIVVFLLITINTTYGVTTTATTDSSSSHTVANSNDNGACPLLTIDERVLPRIWINESQAADDGVAPPKQMPHHWQLTYTRNNTIATASMYVDDSGPKHGGSHYKYRREPIVQMIAQARQMRQRRGTGARSYQWLFDALYEHPINGKHVVVYGSMEPWFESVALAHDAVHG
jgi:hypothetical protein